ncbi:MBL fold metallo-hydrolase [Cnuibacter sp. UC19_7]|uniref:MBL fold metallo-hydrolase n=1 Tax=Cnuibacter sp. UC19_7 TaxID=3350166 RepID=UPI00366ED9DE
MADTNAISAARAGFGIGVIGGPTVVIDLAGLRILVDPTFDPPTDYGRLVKTQGPAVPAEALGSVDLVLVSHDEHADNLDESGRAIAEAAPTIVTTPSAATRLGQHARGLRAWESVDHPSGLTVTATPALHGPADEITPEGWVNCEVTGFLLSGPEAPTVYVGGDNASLAAVVEVASRIRPDVAVLNGGGAHVPARFDDRPLTFTSTRVAAAAEVLGSPRVVVAHQDGWRHFADDAAATRAAFLAAGIEDRLVESPLGRWALRA